MNTRLKSRRSFLRLPFVPAIAVMNRLSFARKFIVVALLLAGPLAIVAWLQYSSTTERIEFTRKELSGVALLAPTTDLLDAVECHRVLSEAVRAGRDDLRPALDGVTADADAALVRARAVDPWKLELWGDIEGRWVRAERASPSASASADHDVLGRVLLDLMLAELGNESNLILDPERDSYWLADALLVKIPSLSEAVAGVGADAIGGPPGDETPAASDAAIAARQDLARSMSEDLARLTLRVATHDPSRSVRSTELARALTEPLRGVKVAIDAQGRQLRAGTALGRAPRATMVVESSLAALERLHALSRQVSPELKALLAAREHGFRTQRTVGIVASGASALVLAYLFIAIYLSVRQSMWELEEAAESEHGVPERFAAPGQDEIAQLAAAYTRVRGEGIVLRERLRLADKLATIGQLAAGTAHELNEPLAAILGFAELAQKCPDLPSLAAQDLAKIARATLHAREIIKQLLLFARQTPPKKARTDLNQVVREGLEMVQGRCDQAEVSVVRDLAADLPAVQADANQVRQAVLNLIVNAVQASPKGGQVAVSTSNDGSAVVIAVEDHGCGMADEVRKNLFLPFYSTKEIGQGTGLGLAVVHGIITAHSGTIHVDSAPDRGTRIEVRLPLPAEAV